MGEEARAGNERQACRNQSYRVRLGAGEDEVVVFVEL